MFRELIFREVADGSLQKRNALLDRGPFGYLQQLPHDTFRRRAEFVHGHWTVSMQCDALRLGLLNAHAILTDWKALPRTEVTQPVSFLLGGNE